MRQLFSCLFLLFGSVLSASLSELPFEEGRDYSYTVSCNVTMGTTGLEHTHQEVLRVVGVGDQLSLEGEIQSATTRLKMNFRGISVVGPWAHASFNGTRTLGAIKSNGRCSFPNRDIELNQTVEGRAMPQIKRETLKAQKEVLWALLEKSGDVPHEPFIVSPELSDPLSLEKEQYNDSGLLLSHWVGCVAAREMPLSEWRGIFDQLGGDGKMALNGLIKICETQGISLEEDTVVYMEGEVSQDGKWDELDHFMYEFHIQGTAMVKAQGRQMPLEVDLKMVCEEL